MEKIFNSLTNTSLDISPETIVFRLITSGIIGILIGTTYSITFDRLSYSNSFKNTVSLISIIICGIIISIGTNIALSLGLVGSLSIIRFRTVIKDPMEMLFLFWSIGSGIGIGSGQVLLVFSLFFIVLGYLVIAKYHFNFLKRKNNVVNFNLNIKLKDSSSLNFESNLSKICKDISLLSSFKNKDDKIIEYNFLISLYDKDVNESSKILKDLLDNNYINSYELVAIDN